MGAIRGLLHGGRGSGDSQLSLVSSTPLLTGFKGTWCSFGLLSISSLTETGRDFFILLRLTPDLIWPRSGVGSFLLVTRRAGLACISAIKGAGIDLVVDRRPGLCLMASFSGVGRDLFVFRRICLASMASFNGVGIDFLVLRSFGWLSIAARTGVGIDFFVWRSGGRLLMLDLKGVGKDLFLLALSAYLL